jgi:hypothetical protein
MIFSINHYLLVFLKEQCNKIFASGFIHESSFCKPLKVEIRPFHIFLKIHRDIHRSRCTTNINHIGGKLPLVSITLAVNLPQLSKTPVINNGYSIRLLTPQSEIEEKIECICSFYHPKVPKLNILNFTDLGFFPFATLSCEYL